MEFSSSKASFSSNKKFCDTMKQFISEEAAIFSPEGEEAASASMDKTLEKLVRLSASKNKAKATEYKHSIEKMTEAKGSKADKLGKEDYKTERDATKKKQSKETRRAATKTAVANMLKAKADMSNDLVSEKLSGNALKDGNSGLVKTFTTFINPMTYLKKWLAQLAATIAPYILLFMVVAVLVIVVVAMVSSMLQPVVEIIM